MHLVHRALFAVCGTAFCAVLTGCPCPTTKCITPPAITFEVRSSEGSTTLGNAAVVGGASEGKIVAVSGDSCFSAPCTHQYFETDGEGARSFEISADGYRPTTVPVSITRTESGCSVVPQRVTVALVPTVGSGEPSKSIEALSNGCAQ